MQDKQDAHPGFVRARLPWLIAAAALLLYLVTLNRWVTLGSLPYVAKVAGWDWTLPLQAPLFFVLTYPLRWLPDGWHALGLNLFTAICSALTLALLARSVALLPHDRTLAQRQRERSEFSLLTIPGAWLPPVFAVLVCGLQLTFWEHATAATNEALDLLLFAYVIRCLLEYRIDSKDSWLTRSAFVYGLGITNNWAFIGFAPLFLTALIWIRGVSFFNLRFLARMFAFGGAGLLLYLLLPAMWAFSVQVDVGFWQSLKAQLVNQKAFLWDTPNLRNRALVLSLTSLLPILIMGIRWPSSFGDTSAAGAALTNLMFRVIHIVFLAACLWIFFDQKFSPRALGYGLPFLTFYYLSALAVGYFSGYVLLVFSEPKSKAWRRRSSGAQFLDAAAKGAVWLAAIAIPVGLAYKNLGVIWKTNGPILRQFAEATARALPEKGAYVLCDEPYALLLLEAYLSEGENPHSHVLVHSRSLSVPEYHRSLLRRYPSRIPNVIESVPAGEVVEDVTLLEMMTEIGRSNAVYYLHPSFGFYFEKYFSRPNGLVCELVAYPTNSLLQTPGLESRDIQTNDAFWNQFQPAIDMVSELVAEDSRDAKEVGSYYSRALNNWGVELQKQNRLDDAAKQFQMAVNLNSNNIPARINLEYNRSLRTGESRTNQINKIVQEQLGAANWESILVKNGPFDHPDFCFRLGQIFSQQTLFRQAAAQFERAFTLDPTHMLARLGMIDLQIKSGQADEALQQVAVLKQLENPASKEASVQLELVRLEAAAHLAKSNFARAEQVLLEAEKSFPNEIGVLDSLVRLYGQAERYTNALQAIEKVLRLAPDNIQAGINEATIYFNSKQYDEALASLDRVLSRHPNNLQALLYKVFMLIETKDYAQARAAVDRVLDIDPESHQGLLYQAVIEIETKNYDSAIEPLNKLLDSHPPADVFLNALRNRAIANLHRGKLTEAKADYQNLQRHIPRYYPAYFGLGEIAYQRKETADAVNYYELYLKYVSNAPALEEEKKLVKARLDELKAAAR